MAGHEKIKVLAVDDSAMMRRTIKQILESDPEIMVVGTARNGADALEKDLELKPDVITMDINMPVMDGITCMLYLLEQHPEVKVIMLSSLTQKGAMTTFEALELGAFDYVAKPSGTVSANLRIIGKELIAKIKVAARQSRRGSRLSSFGKGKARGEAAPATKVSKTTADACRQVEKVVVIGVSTGGPSTLMEILPELPGELNAAIIVVQHMPPAFTNSFAKRLDDYCRLPFKEAKSGEPLATGHGLVVPGGVHLVIRKSTKGNEYLVRLTNYPTEALFVPSVDVTMNSVVELWGDKTIGVLLTGMGADGAEGMVKIRQAGGITIAEDESTAIVFGMPREAIERGGAEIVAPSHRIAQEIIKAVNRK